MHIIVLHTKLITLAYVSLVLRVWWQNQLSKPQVKPTCCGKFTTLTEAGLTLKVLVIPSVCLEVQCGLLESTSQSSANTTKLNMALSNSLTILTQLPHDQ